MSTALVKPEASAVLSPVDPPVIVVPAYDIPHAAATVYSHGFETYSSLPSTQVYSQDFSAGSLDGWAAISPGTVSVSSALLMASRASGTSNWGASRTFSGLTIGRSYTATATVYANTSAGSGTHTGAVGVTGIGTGTPVIPGSSGPASKVTVTYTFTATATSHVVNLNSTLTLSQAVNHFWDDVTLTANLYVTNTGLDGWAANGSTLVFGVGAYTSHGGSYALQWTKNTATAVVRTVTGLTIGRSYTFSAWVRSSTVKSAQVGVTGIGNGTSTSLVANTYTQLTYTFTATATSHELRIINVDTGAYLWDDILLVRDAWVEHVPDVTTTDMELPVSGGKVTLDESWSPYVQAEVEVPLSDLELLERIDPRDNQRVALSVGDPVGGTDRVFDLALRGRTVDHKSGKVTLALASDEALLFDKRRLAGTVDSTPRTHENSLRALCSWALGKIGATLAPGTADAALPAAWDSTNLILDPRYTGTAGQWSQSAVTTAFNTSWPGSVDGVAHNAIQVSAPSNVDGFVNVGATSGMAFGMQVGKTYVFSATGRVTTAIGGTGPSEVDAAYGTVLPRQRALVVHATGTGFSPTYWVWHSPQVSNTINTDTRVSVKFTVPPDTLHVFLRAYHGGSSGVINWSQFSLVEVGPGTAADDAEYFFGSKPATSKYAYKWRGVADASPTERTAILERSPALFNWKPGQSLNDFLRPLVEASGLVLFCDENRVWRLVDPTDYEVPGYVVVQSKYNATEGSDTISRNTDEWGTGVLVIYRWTDSEGISHEEYDFAGTDDKVITIERESEYPGPGAAAYYLNSRQGRGRTQEVTALTNYFATPSQDVTINLPGTLTQTGKVRRVTFGLSDGLMDVGTRGLTDALPGSWATWNPSQVWSAVNPTLKWKDA